MPNALFFDAAYTLIHPAPSVGALYASQARRHGVEVEAAAIEAAFGAAWAEERGRVAQGPPYGRTDAESRRFWRGVVERVFHHVGATMPHGDFFDELYDLFGTAQAWRLDDEAIVSIEAARAAGWRVGVLSNFDGRLHGLLRDLDVTHRLDALIVSCDAGFEKPDPAIYAMAKRTVGAMNGDIVAMVGDSPAEDHDAPRALGWRAALVDPRGKHTARADTQRAATLREAVELLLP